MRWSLCPAVAVVVLLWSSLQLAPTGWAQESPPEGSPEPPAVQPEETGEPEKESAEESSEPQQDSKSEQEKKDREEPKATAKPQKGEEPQKDGEPQENPEPKADEEAEEGAKSSKDADAKEDTKGDDSDKKPAEPEFTPVEWNDEIEKVLERRYPRNVADLKVIQEQTQRVIKHVDPAVVSVRVGQAFGSAVIVSPDGLVLTAGHVVGKPGEDVVFIFADGKMARGKTLGMFREIDSGMMQITDPGPWPYVKLAKKNELETGEWVVVMSHPGGFDPDRTPPVRLGRVLFSNDDVICTDCTLVGGDSGGPLFNMHGEVVGINSRIGRRITDNFHVPIGTYHDTWDRLVAGESWGSPLGGQAEVEARPLLGVTGNPKAADCRLSQVFPGMPADRAGLKVGDVIRSFNGKPVKNFDALVDLVYSNEARKSIKLEVERGDEKLEVEVQLAQIQQPLPGSADLPKKGSNEKEQRS
ncbi:trypsin-like peptidase domain-containing protein [Aeoliella sp. SH292]|uniref:S1C family serine protease n=1 Tax=Aeoliella sp. SH292 TaxID=3454464 RepID=UPI003F943A8F